MNPLYWQIKLLQYFFVVSLIIISDSLHAKIASTPLSQQYDEIISTLYHNLPPSSTLPMPARLNIISQHFLNTPYLLGALGEGKQGRFDQSPLYRFDGFDCETYVDTVLALAFANNLATFKHYINQIRYHNGQIDFLKRNHFTAIDWNQHNQQQGFIRDITLSFKDKQQHPIAKTAITLIDKANWYQHFDTSHIKLLSTNEQQRQERLTELKMRGGKLPNAKSIIAYLPLTALFDSQHRPNHYLFAQIPHGAIIEIVRPNWDLRKQIGTYLDISHLGFAFWHHGQLVFRQASLTANKVIDISLIDYLNNTLSSPTIKGINVQVVNTLSI